MRRILVLMSAITLLLIAVVPAAAAGGDADCTDFPLVSPPGEYPAVHLIQGEVIDGNLVVPPGVWCPLLDTTVNGDVTVEQGAFLTEIAFGTTVNGNVDFGNGNVGFVAGAEVHGNVLVGEDTFSALFFGAYVSGDFSCDHCNGVDIVYSTVEGNVQIKGEKEGSWFVDSTIGGNLQIEDSSVSEIGFWALGTTVEGNLEIKNSKGQGELLGNTVGGNLEFKDNRGGRTLIADNVIEGNLTCDGNKRKPTGSGNTADQLEGQCKNL